MTKEQAKEELLSQYETIVMKESIKFCGRGASIVRTAYEAAFERAFKLAVNMMYDRIGDKPSPLDSVQEAVVVEKTKPPMDENAALNEPISASSDAVGNKGKKKK